MQPTVVVGADWTLHPWHQNSSNIGCSNIVGVTAGQERHNSGTVGGVTAGQVKHNYGNSTNGSGDNIPKPCNSAHFYL